MRVGTEVQPAHRKDVFGNYLQGWAEILCFISLFLLSVSMALMWLFTKFFLNHQLWTGKRGKRNVAELTSTAFLSRVSQMALVVKNLPAKAGDAREAGLISGLGRCPGGGHGNPLQYSCMENPIDKGAWWAVVHGVAESDTAKVT